MAGSVVVGMSGDERALMRSLQSLERQQEKLEQKFRGIGKAGQRAGTAASKAGQTMARAFDPQRIVQFGAGLVSVQSTLGLITRSYEAQDRALQRISQSATKAAEASVSLASILAVGERRGGIQRVSALASEFGFGGERFGEVANVVQAMASRHGGDLTKGLAAARPVFEATRLGIPLESAFSLETVGGAAGMAPGDAIRYAYAAGKASEQSPQVIARAGKALPFFGDKRFAFSAAATLSPLFGEELGVYTKAAGVALQSTSGLSGTFGKLGVLGGATQEQRLAALASAGITTTEQLSTAGLGETRQQVAIATLLSNRARLAEYGQAITRDAVPGLLARERAGVEAELPEAAMARRIASARAQSEAEIQFGDTGVAAQRRELGKIRRGIAMRRAGMFSFGGVESTDELGAASDIATIANVGGRIASVGAGGGATSLANIGKVLRFFDELSRTTEELERFNVGLRAATDATAGGPSQVKTEVDK